MPVTFDRENTASGSVCEDCRHLIANGAVPDDFPADTVEEYLAEINRRMEGVETVSMGHFHDSDRCSHPGEECEEDCDCEITTSSKMPCDHCGSWLAGTREDVTYWLKPSPDMQDMPKSRVSLVGKYMLGVLEMYRVDSGSCIEEMHSKHEVSSVVGDLLVDLMHVTDHFDLDFDTILSSAWSVHAEEVALAKIRADDPVSNE